MLARRWYPGFCGNGPINLPDMLTNLGAERPEGSPYVERDQRGLIHSVGVLLKALDQLPATIPFSSEPYNWTEVVRVVRK
jgi:hypothetical protein